MINNTGYMIINKMEYRDNMEYRIITTWDTE